MRIKKFVGRTVKEATEEMKKDLGEDAIILSSRKVPKGGLFSFVGKEMVEITGAVDEVPPVRRSVPTDATPAGSFSRHLTAAADGVEMERPVEGIQKVAERFETRLREKRHPVSPASPAMPERTNIAALTTEMEDMRGTLHTIAEHLKYTRMPALPDYLQRAYVTLVQHDVDEQLAADVVQQVYANLPKEQLSNKQLMETELLATLTQKIVTALPAKRGKRKTRVVALVGPTGVGKTTTIAKLAALSKLVDHQDVGLISTDTYRIGAIEQLRTFASIADIPMEVAYRPAEMTVALRRFRDKEVVYIDTVGRSQRARRDLDQLKRFLEVAEPDEIHLVLNASTGAKTAYDILEQFRVLGPDRILFSKLDEAVTYGPIMNIACRQRMPLSYVTVGQGVPDDIRPADSSYLASIVYRGEFAHA
jgi:flagellar biosynthesis protein FlhF